MPEQNVLEAAGSTIELQEGNYTFQLLQKITPRIPGELPYQPKLQLPPRAMAHDPATGQARKIRFIEGVKSFWMDEHKDIGEAQAKSSEWIPEFIKGVLTLRYPEDEAKIRCLLARDEYDGKARRVSQRPPVYTLVNKEGEYKTKVSFIEERHKAEGYAIAATDEEMMDHIAALNINPLDGLRKKTTTEIREEYLQKAFTDPKLFVTTFGDPVIKQLGLVKEALKTGVIDLQYVKDEAHWGDSKALIMTLNKDKESDMQLAEFSMTKEGEAFRKQLSAKVKGEGAAKTKKKA